MSNPLFFFCSHLSAETIAAHTEVVKAYGYEVTPSFHKATYVIAHHDRRIDVKGLITLVDRNVKPLPTDFSFEGIVRRLALREEGSGEGDFRGKKTLWSEDWLIQSDVEGALILPHRKRAQSYRIRVKFVDTPAELPPIGLVRTPSPPPRPSSAPSSPRYMPMAALWRCWDAKPTESSDSSEASSPPPSSDDSSESEDSDEDLEDLGPVAGTSGTSGAGRETTPDAAAVRAEADWMKLKAVFASEEYKAALDEQNRHLRYPAPFLLAPSRNH